MTASVRVTGMDRLMRVLLRGGDKAVDATRRALYEEAQIILGKAVRIVPFEHGTLAGSGMVHDPVVQGRDVLVEISFGGPAKDRTPRKRGVEGGGVVNVGYAFIQHENLSFRHAPGRRAKYLQEPVEQAQKGLQDKLTRRVSAIIEGLV